MENDKINDEFYASEDEEIREEKPIEESNLQSEEPKESSIEETQETKEEHEDPNILSNNTFEVEKEESQVEGSTEVPADVELSRTAELRMMFGESPTPSKPKNNEQNNNEQKNRKHKNKHKNKNKPNENKVVEQNNVQPNNENNVQQSNEQQNVETNNNVQEKIEQNNEVQQNEVQQNFEQQHNEPLHIEQEHIEPKHIDPIPEPERIPFSGNELKIKEEPEVPKVPENTKYTGFSSRIIRYVLFMILSLVFLTIAIVGLNKFKKDTSTYTENSTINYQVCLKENDYYKDQCIGEEKEYITSATESIRLDYSYNAVYQKATKKDYKYYVKSTLLIKTDDDNEKELLKKEKALTKKQDITLDGNVMTIAETIDIPFQDYNSYAQRYKNDYSLVSNCYLEISLILKDGKNETELSSVTMPLTKLTYNITKDEKVNAITEYKISANTALKIAFILLVIIGAGLMIFSLYDLGKFLMKMRRNESAYEKKLKQILNTYDRVIVSLEDKNRINPNEDIYTVKSFLELLDVRDTIDKPILYYRVNNIKTEFYVQDVNKTYKYTMKESDFEEKQ